MSASESTSPQTGYATGLDQSKAPPRKKMRKGTKSCIECRRRKIRCNFEPGRTSICNECFARGSTCIDQEHGDVSSFTTSTTVLQQKEEQNLALKERVSMLESMVKQVLDRLPEKRDSSTSTPTADESSSQADAQAAEVLKSLKSPSRPQNAFEDTILVAGGAHGNGAPALSLFNNAVISTREVPVTISRAQYNKTKSLIAALLELLPTPEDLELILENSQEWWTIWRAMYPEITDRRCGSIKESVSHSLRSENPAEIAKIMLCIALSINQLPQDFDWDRISIKENSADLMERYITIIDRLIISDEEIAATIEGLECMILAAKYHINLGRPRRSWLLHRRAIAFGQLLGLHRLSMRRPKEPDAAYYRQLGVWAHLVTGDRYLSLVLGLPYNVAETFAHASMTEAAAVTQNTAPGEAYLARTAPMITKLIDRNQSPTTVPYSVTLNLDRELDDLQSTTSREWWTTERLPGSTVEEHFDRLQAQFFHYQVKVLLHMPFMLRSSTDKLYQYSHAATLHAARDMIRYFDALRGAEHVGPHICKLLDFQAFTAAMLLLLNICGYNSHVRGGVPQQPDLQQDQEDSALIDRTITLLRTAANEPGGIVASQCAKALDMLGKIRSGLCDKSEEAQNESCQIAIPYFGTISVGMGKNFVPIKPGTYPEAGTVRRSLSTAAKSHHRTQNQPSYGLPTPNSSIHSAQPSPQVRGDGVHQSPYENPDSAPEGMENSWTVSTEDPFITFDSFMAFPEVQFMNFDSAPHLTPSSNMTTSGDFSQQMPGINQQQAINLYGPQFQEQNFRTEGFPFPSTNSGLELDNGWNWLGVDGPVFS